MTDLDTRPEQAPRHQSPTRRVLAGARNIWRGLTSMRTALVLLFLLAFAAIPGALVPQRSLNAGKVDEYIAARPTLGPLMDRLELFDVFSSFWFTAIYVLLFVSLIGCILPRCIEHGKALRTRPVRAPRNLSRLPHHRRYVADGSPEDTAAIVQAQFRGWRVEKRESNGEVTLSAEKGYLREFGNLVFHISLVLLLAAIALGKLFGYEGNVVVIANDGPGICSTSPAIYDSFRAGNLVDGTGLEPLCVRVEDFKADYLENGQAEQFTSNIEYQAGEDLANNVWKSDVLQVNHPLRVAGDRVYLQGHGYAPTFTVTFPNGETRTETIQWQPTDATTFLSSGVMRIDPPGGLYPDAEDRRKNQIAIEGLFAPTAFFHDKLLSSSFPAMTDPAVAIDIYKGDTGLDTGLPQSLFTLNQEMINQGRLVKQDRINLKPGEASTLSDGTTVRFDGAEEFVNLQVSHDPAQTWVLVFALTMMSGLLVSLVIKRRRVWVRLLADADPRRTVVELGGLARTDQAGWGEEFDNLCERLIADVKTVDTNSVNTKNDQEN
ncbi:cytochrome c biogenesis protein ResB [Rhodococcus sp. PAMC28707]|uniref:cytochrome c biogenesis protein ResB n=1 Tax=unclassified Rhodococcus (in: high G+C Gram-positive bacteria) TaxID=192944 RepID=UPI00109D9168|nr:MULTISPECIES: cytochrome c biogenesis protein ResB [unclassified Rhodococcus (in: high G+C Gram-positive bacteria)]QCB48880.1 cytochrome c biogenesis protein ResB [Rhodococcus sp. PAMC28705]QCB59433.1 cytochrome c biogenesis protein ResB [Rhodococcus sp. PAMC28707]